MVLTPGSRSGRWADGGTLPAIMPGTPPAAAKPMSAEEKREVLQTDHFQVGYEYVLFFLTTPNYTPVQSTTGTRYINLVLLTYDREDRSNITLSFEFRGTTEGSFTFVLGENRSNKVIYGL